MRRIEERLGATFVRRGKALRGSSDGTTHLVCMASQRYLGAGGSGNYWYGFTPAQRDFVNDASAGYISLVCGDSQKAFLFTREEFLSWTPEFLTTPAAPASVDQLRHWHVYFNDYGNRVELMRAGGGAIIDLMKYAV